MSTAPRRGPTGPRRTLGRSAWVAPVLAILGVLLTWWLQGAEGGSQRPADSDAGQASSAPQRPSDSEGLPVVQLDRLPAEATRTIARIEAGGPYPYDRDGVDFGNYEGLLPQRERGYYREYTVPTPGLDHRGARRIVTGGATYYWTADHYQSFARIQR